MNDSDDITGAEHLGGHRLRLRFADGVVGDVDLTARIRAARGPMFEPLKDVGYFASVSVDRELGTVVWPNGADLAPEVLRELVLSRAGAGGPGRSGSDPRDRAGNAPPASDPARGT